MVGALLPENAILVDEALTSGVGSRADLGGAAARLALAHRRRDRRRAAHGARRGSRLPDRPVIGIQADGSAMYTISALWSYAREQPDITTIVCDNGSYAILEHELTRVGAEGDGKRAAQLLDLGGPNLDLSRSPGHGVPASRATTAEELADQLRTALAEPGPHLIDAVLTQVTGTREPRRGLRRPCAVRDVPSRRVMEARTRPARADGVRLLPSG